ncbi:MAG: biopolymer transporter ExbD [Planctomycetia bacterium]|nr:biopolymer transporter ExbD [Planctomycetia bacterium]
MRLTNRRHGSKIDLQMTSMIDCVFLLLIFFMVTSNFNRTERELDTGLATETRTVKASGDLAPIIVEVIRGDGGFVFKVGGRQIASREELTVVLRKIENKLDGAFVRATDEAPFLLASGAIQACKDAGFLKTTYAPRLDTK